jgi:hypothetical protein
MKSHRLFQEAIEAPRRRLRGNHDLQVTGTPPTTSGVHDLGAAGDRGSLRLHSSERLGEGLTSSRVGLLADSSERLRLKSVWALLVWALLRL